MSNDYYKILQIENLGSISNELKHVLDQEKNLDLEHPYNFLKLDLEKIFKCDALSTWLESKNLLSDLRVAAVSIAGPNSNGPIHIDGIGVEAINFPIYNCEHGYMSWYNARYKKTAVATETGKSTDLPIGYIHCSQKDSEMLCRAPSYEAMWVNTTIPHRGENYGDKSRAILSLRFNNVIDKDVL
jgi:hypothetical protein